MEVLAVEWLVVFVQNYIWEISLDVKKGIITKWKFKRFQKELDASLSEFCNRNECIYLNSSAFQYFIEHFDFVAETVSRATATKINKSNREFLRDYIKTARSVAESEEIVFGHDEERLIKDLYKLINEKASDFFSKMLSAEQRIIISKTINSIAELRDEVRDFRNDADNNFLTINESLRKIAKLSESQEIIMAELVYKSIWENDFETLDKLKSLIEGKSLSLELFLDAITFLFGEDKSDKAVDLLIKIENANVRDFAIKTLLPIFVLNNHDVSVFEQYISAKTLKIVVAAVHTKEYGCLFEEKIDIDNGTEIHSFSINKKMIYEEEWLTKHIVLLYLYRLPIRNVSSAMKEIIGDKANWLDEILIEDKYIDSICNDNPAKIDKKPVEEIKNKLQKKTKVASWHGKNLQVLYYSLLLKIDFILRENEVEELIPDEIRECSPIDAFLFMKRIERHECSIDVVQEFVNKTGAYWILNNYFIDKKEPEFLIAYCKQDESILEKDPMIFFLFLSALKISGKNRDRKSCLIKYKALFGKYYEFWNEYLEIDTSKNVSNEFLYACSEGKLICLFDESEWLLIERLLQLQEYNAALPYIRRIELKGGDKNRITKYKAVIEQSKGNQVEALALFRECFEGLKLDSYVVDSIITISLMNNRKVEDKYIRAAETIGTSRLFMLAAAAYKNNGDVANAKLANKKSMLRSKEDFCGAYGQYLALDISEKSDSIQKISGFEENTCARCKDDTGNCVYVCIEGERVLPTNPFEWQGHIFMYKEDAAEIGALRKHTGDSFEIKYNKYVIEELIPLDAFYVRMCFSKMEKAGVAQTISIETKEGKPDITALTEWLLQNSKDESNINDWLKQYNNIEDVPLSLFVYKRFARFSYLQFVDMIFDEKNIFIREYKCEKKQMCKDKKYILTFGAAIMLYKIGFPVEKLIASNVFITSSTFMQINSDSLRIIDEYDRENVASMGVYEGQLFLNQADEDKKEYWLKEAGRIKKYYEDFPQTENLSDVTGEFLTKFDAKEMLGICDYDAIALAQNDDSFCLITLEALVSAFAINGEVGVDYISLMDLISGIEPACTTQLHYVKKLMSLGCLYSLNRWLIQSVSQNVSKADEVTQKEIYSILDEIMKSIDSFEEKIKLLAIQSIAEEVKILQDEGVELDSDIIHILTMNILLLKRQKIEICVDNAGHIVSYLRDMTEEEKKSAMIALGNIGK